MSAVSVGRFMLHIIMFVVTAYLVVGFASCVVGRRAPFHLDR